MSAGSGIPGERHPLETNPMKPTVIVLLLAAFILPVEAKKKRGNGGRDKQEEQQKKKEKAERDRKREAINDYLEKKDKNHDGSVTRDEHLADESDKDAAGKKFDEANKNGDRSLTKSEIADMLGL
jgi:hypothetical protein